MCGGELGEAQMGEMQESQGATLNPSMSASVLTTATTTGELAQCAGSRVSLQPARTGTAYPVRAFGSNAGGRLVRMSQTFDSERGGFVPETFIRGVSARGMRLLTYVVTDIIDVWQIPVPWWRADASEIEGGDAREQAVDAADVHTQLAPMSRTVWRVAATPAVSFAGYHICGAVMDIAHDPDGTWSVVRIHD